MRIYAEHQSWIDDGSTVAREKDGADELVLKRAKEYKSTLLSNSKRLALEADAEREAKAQEAAEVLAKEHEEAKRELVERCERLEAERSAKEVEAKELVEQLQKQLEEKVAEVEREKEVAVEQKEALDGVRRGAGHEQCQVC